MGKDDYKYLPIRHPTSACDAYRIAIAHWNVRQERVAGKKILFREKVLSDKCHKKQLSAGSSKERIKKQPQWVAIFIFVPPHGIEPWSTA